MSRTEFSAATKRAAWERANGQCEHRDATHAEGWQVCFKRLFPGDIFYDHVIPDALGGDNSLSNCQVLCKAHHDPKTRAEDVPRIAKMKRQRAKHVGAVKSRRSSLSHPKLKRRMDGQVVSRRTGKPIARHV